LVRHRRKSQLCKSEHNGTECCVAVIFIVISLHISAVDLWIVGGETLAIIG
jgi:hypothetical protein